jgi:flagellar hook-associated protein 1 FlgK
VNDVNAIAAQVAEYNRQIGVAQAEGRSPNDLLDSRDVLLDKLATLTGSMPVSSEGGLLSVYLDGRPLIQGATAYPLSITSGAGGVEIRSSYDNSVIDVQKGEIGGLVYGRDVAIPKYLGELNALATSLVAEVNARHQSGFGLDAVTGRDFFVTGSTAGDIAVDPAVLADVRAIAAGATEAPGDGTIALEIANLRTTPVIANRSLDEYAQAFLGMVGTDVHTSEDGAKAQQFALDQIHQLQQSVSGVSIDEEITYLILSQRAYQAAARVVTTADEMIGIVLERMGV